MPENNLKPKNAHARHIALMGTRGVPARYGGFETAMEEIGQRLVADGHEVTVYCRSGNSGQEVEPTEYLGMKLVHLPALRHRSLETLSHTFLSAAHTLLTRRSFDAVVLCNSANAVALPLLRLARTLDLPLVATNDVHYGTKDDAEAALYLSCIKNGRSYEEAKNRHHGSFEMYLKTAEEMAATLQ